MNIFIQVGVLKSGRDRPHTNYLLDELATEFKKITGKSMEDVMNSAEKEYNLENAQQLLHQTKLYANEIGGQTGSAFPAEKTLHLASRINPGIRDSYFITISV